MTYIIAEIGVNHNGDMGLAKQLVDVAKEAGVQAVKFQTFQSDQVVVESAPKANYQLKSTSSNESQKEMIRKLELSKSEHLTLLDYTSQKDLDFLSSPFDLMSAEFLCNELNLKCIKIASGEITNAPLLYQIAQSGKEVILSTGMATMDEIKMALAILFLGYHSSQNDSLSSKKLLELLDKNSFYEGLKNKVSLLHCVTEYPAPFEEMNLNAIKHLKESFGLKVGLSDHTEGIEASLASIVLGAQIIEKHITLDKSLDGPDHKASLDPRELFDLVKGVRNTEKALCGSGLKEPAPCELKNREIARKGLVARHSINKGEQFTKENLAIKRPLQGLSPLKYWDLLDKKASKSYKQDEVISDGEL